MDFLQPCWKFCTKLNKILHSFFFLKLETFLNCNFWLEDFSSDISYQTLMLENAGRLCLKLKVFLLETLQSNPRDNSNAFLTTLPEAFRQKRETICSQSKRPVPSFFANTVTMVLWTRRKRFGQGCRNLLSQVEKTFGILFLFKKSCLPIVPVDK